MYPSHSKVTPVRYTVDVRTQRGLQGQGDNLTSWSTDERGHWWKWRNDTAFPGGKPCPGRGGWGVAGVQQAPGASQHYKERKKVKGTSRHTHKDSSPRAKVRSQTPAQTPQTEPAWEGTLPLGCFTAASPGAPAAGRQYFPVTG